MQRKQTFFECNSFPAQNQALQARAKAGFACMSKVHCPS